MYGILFLARGVPSLMMWGSSVFNIIMIFFRKGTICRLAKGAPTQTNHEGVAIVLKSRRPHWRATCCAICCGPQQQNPFTRDGLLNPVEKDMSYEDRQATYPKQSRTWRV